MYDALKYYYINLKHRTDRNQHIIDQFHKFNIKNYERIEADTGNGNPVIGCARSHISALQQFIQSDNNYCIILEDDFIFTISYEKYKSLFVELSNHNISWDIILLAGNIIKANNHNHFLRKCINVQTTPGYLIHKNFANTLLNNFKESAECGYPIDMHWKWLQRSTYNFLIFSPKCGKQLNGYSDIKKRNTNYRC